MANSNHTPLTVAEARAIMIADLALELSFEARERSCQTLDLAEGAAWQNLVASAKERINAYEKEQERP